MRGLMGSLSSLTSTQPKPFAAPIIAEAAGEHTFGEGVHGKDQFMQCRGQSVTHGKEPTS